MHCMHVTWPNNTFVNVQVLWSWLKLLWDINTFLWGMETQCQVAACQPTWVYASTCLLLSSTSTSPFIIITQPKSSFSLPSHVLWNAWDNLETFLPTQCGRLLSHKCNALKPSARTDLIALMVLVLRVSSSLARSSNSSSSSPKSSAFSVSPSASAISCNSSKPNPLCHHATKIWP